MGMTKDVLEFYAQQNVQGIIIEALGQGNLPPSCLKGIESCVKKIFLSYLCLAHLMAL